MRAVIVVAALAMIALAACSGDGGPETVEQATPSQPGTEAPTLPSPPSPMPTAVEREASTATVEEVPETATPVAQPARESRMDPLPPVEFPDGLVLLAHYYPPTQDTEGIPPLDLVRIYRKGGDGELVRETLFAGSPGTGPTSSSDWYPECGDDYREDYFSVDYDDIKALTGRLPECGGYYDVMSAWPDGSSIIMTICVEYACTLHSKDGSATGPTGRTAIYESRDGGVTWDRLAIFDLPWEAYVILPGNDGETRLRLVPGRPFDNGAWPGVMLWPDGGDVTEETPRPIMPCPEWYCVSISDDRSLLMERYEAEDLVDLMGAAMGFMRDDGVLFHNSSLQREDTLQRVHWPTIRDSKTLEEWPVRLPFDVFRPGDTLVPVAVQLGPFLRVVVVGDDCLPLRAEPSLEAAELACVAERVLLTDLDEAMEIDGTTWRRARTPAGIEGWADSRYLE